MKIFRSNHGYTLVELLAVITILTVLSVAISGVIFSTLRGTTRTNITTNVAQNGEYARGVIAGIISDSRNIIEVDGTSIDDCASVTPPSSTTTIKFKRIDGGTTLLSCEELDGVYTIASNGASLLNTSVVKASSCNFSCSQVVADPYSIPIVNVTFTVSEKNAGSFETKSQATFDASSSLRVYSP